MLIGILEQIASVTSVEIAERLAKAYGGTRLYLPKEATINNPLAQLIGIYSLQKIIAHFGYGDIVLPAGDYRGAGAKAKLIKRLVKQGYSTRDIALMADCCERTVWHHKQKMAHAVSSMQLRLF